MPRIARAQPGGYVFHVINRGNARMAIFDDDADYAAFEHILAESIGKNNMRLISYCLMPNHWHLVLRPHEDGDLARFMHRLTTTHVRRWHKHRHTIGCGHLYQGTYKSFPVQTDDHFLKLCRYVERNALRAKLVNRAENWRWCSLWQRHNANETDNDLPTLTRWPIHEPHNWLSIVNGSFNKKMEAEDLELIRTCIQRSRPFGGKRWQTSKANELGLESTLRPRGRPCHDDKN